MYVTSVLIWGIDWVKGGGKNNLDYTEMSVLGGSCR